MVRQKYPIPTVDSLIDEIGDSNVFSKIDLRLAYTQIELDEQSSELTSFITDEGVYKFNRCISDGIIVYSKNIHKHKELLSKLFQRLKVHGFKVNGSKCLIGKSTISFFGIILSSSGIGPEKVRCLSNANAPTNVSELKSCLGLCTYMSFIQNFSEKTTPLRELVKKDVKFTWTYRHEQAFQMLKSELTSNTVLTFFDPRKPITLWVDASNYAIDSRIRKNAPTGENITNEYANFITNNSVPHSMSLNEIPTASENDDVIQEIRKALTSDNWSSLQKYEVYKEEYCEVNGIILRRDRLFIPKSSVQKSMEIAHRSCLGIVKLKSLLRCKVYWYNMDKDIENLIQSCPSCQKIRRQNKPTPVQMTELPTSTWSHIAADFYGNLPTGEKILVITDLFSKFPIVEVMKSTTFNIVSTRLDNLFSIFGYPDMIKTNNGPPWDSHEIDLFFKSRGIVHNSSIP
ncbi:uncharacterized protein K02A2.6-like [Hydractinia symbiolongicarpus]|uniref:uncharacterized protein K02A2.6-like n=1 Tax=Hydractinia symbiolongicarpus TaxID=13093 RepID=UPI002551115E|nr:uncharacterized protein K02A2.6-like [Hydractinia symbiolongicarpus]